MKLRKFGIGLGTIGLAVVLAGAPVSHGNVNVRGNGERHGQGHGEGPFCHQPRSSISQASNGKRGKRDVRLSVRSLAKRVLNRLAAPFGVKIVGNHDWSNTRNFIPFERTIDAAERSGLSVGDYIDAVLNNIPGATRATIEGMSRLGVFSEQIATVLEIGPGSGRFLEKTLEACSPTRYEVYETAGPWASYVVSKYNAVLQPTDGRTLRATSDGSVDLVHAHKVFSAIPFLETYTYWTEMARVARSGSHVVFDIMTEACLDSNTLEKWVDSATENGSYPAVMPRALAIDCFESRGFELVGAFIGPMGPGTTETFVFRKT